MFGMPIGQGRTLASRRVVTPFPHSRMEMGGNIYEGNTIMLVVYKWSKVEYCILFNSNFIGINIA